MSNEKTVSGFDMTPTLLWYWHNLAAVAKCLPSIDIKIRGVNIPTPCFKGTVNEDGTRADVIDASSFVGLAALLPPAALARSHLRNVVIKKPQWFRCDSTGEKPVPTTDIGEALSPGAIIPSYVSFHKWEDGECPTGQFPYGADISMYRMPGTGLPHELLEPLLGTFRLTLRRIVWSQAFLHEFAHSIVTPVLFGDRGKHKLRLPNGSVYDQYGFLLEAMPIIRGLAPISHYASAYREPDGSLTLSAEGSSPHRALNENLVEAIVARLLGFAFQPDGNGLEPFARAEPLRDFVDAFLNAEWVD